MSSLNMTNIDEITMRLVHYFVTKENYQPIVVNGIENEIWLENTEKHYEVIRINSNYIHNDEQLNFDIFKAKRVVRQIKKKMLSLNCNTLTILLNVGDNVNVLDTNERHMDLCTISKVEELENGESISSIFPEIKYDTISATDDMDFFINVTHDINETTEKKNKLYEKTFKKKRIVITYALIIINIIIYFLQMAGIIDYNMFAMNSETFNSGKFWVIITSAFMHANILHLACNMYSLYLIGTQLETVMGKIKFLVVYFISAIIAALLSGVVNGATVTSVGASGAIFGLMGALLYFGYHYRLYLGNVIMSQLVPVILLNLFIGATNPAIDNWAHIGGLVGGLFAAMMVGIEGKTNKSDTINGTILSCVLIGFLIFMLFR